MEAYVTWVRISFDVVFYTSFKMEIPANRNTIFAFVESFVRDQFFARCGWRSETGFDNSNFGFAGELTSFATIDGH
jgi:hypothetical protein